MPETTQKYWLSHLRPCINIEISWDDLQFLCISMCRSLLWKVWVIPSQSMQKNGYSLGRSPISMHLLVPEPTKRYQISHLRACRQSDISWDSPQFLCISLCRSLLKNMSYPIPDHAEKLILAETVFNFYALACAIAYSKIWVIPSQTMQKNWY